MFDTAIIGTGAAGVSAALTLKSLKKDFIWFGPERLSAKISQAEKIRNYPGLPFVSGDRMREIFMDQIRDMEIGITPKTVTGVYSYGDHFGILCGNESFEARTVILCTGVEAVKPIPGELEYTGRGVSYCATCDGFLYKGKTIVVECTSKELEHEIEYLAGEAAKVYLVPLYKNPDIRAENVETVMKKPLRIEGGLKVQKVVFEDREIETDGVFMLKAAITPSVLVGGIETEGGHIVVSRACETNLAGCFAAGDCTGRPYQYAKAAGEGNVAAHAAVDYLAANK